MATIFSDDFNRADADSLGGDWTERGADFDIVPVSWPGQQAEVAEVLPG